MKQRLRSAWLCAIVLAAASFALGAESDVKMAFTISMDQPSTHLYHVVYRCEGLESGAQDFKMPVWMPGYYGVMDYAKYVQDFQAVDESGSLLVWEKTADNVWRVDGGKSKALTISYDVKATVSFIVHSYLDEKRGYISPAGVFMHVAGRLRNPVTVAVKPYEKWSGVATGLDPVPGKPQTFTAPDFDVLYDCPILIGNLETLPFEVRGIPHEFVGWNLPAFDRAKFTSELKRMVEASVALIGDIPYKKYVFLAVGPGGGGIEHLNSSALSFSGTEVGTPEGNLRWLSFVAHEYFHLYNVKSIRPIALGPFDYDRPNRTRLLWISEGMTVYYEYIVLRRAGLMTPEDVFKGLGSAIAGYENKPGHLVQSVAQSSYETWEQGPFGGDPDKSISYYDKGAGLGLLLDLKIRHESQGTKSLDDVMRTLYRDFFQEKKRGFTEREFREICERFAGVPLDEIFEYANTVKDIDYAKYLGYAGLEIDRPRELDEPAIGATFRDSGGLPVISRVERNSAADRAGLKSKDIILSAEGDKFDSQSLTAHLNSKKPGETVTIAYSRDNQKGEAKVVLSKKMYPGFAITRIANPDPRQAAIYDGWMKN